MTEAHSQPIPELIERLCAALAREHVQYCHWKSNAAIERSALGINDLDLLVHRADSQAFLSILFQLGFKESQSFEESIMPGVHNYYAFDAATDRIINVHAHYQLILGHDFTKNYRIPVEPAYLNSSTQSGLFRIPAPEFELIILVIRLAIKHFTWDALLLRHGKLSSAEKGEFDFLLRQTTTEKILETLSGSFTGIDPQAFHACLRALQSETSTWERLQVGQKLVNSLAHYARRPTAIDAGYKLWRRVSIPIQRRVFGVDLRKHMRGGGLMVAIVGGDGAGKTTAIEGLYRSLAQDFAVRKIHMGKPAWSLLTCGVRGALKIGRTLGFYPFQRAEIQYTSDPNLLAFPGYPWLFREVCTARDRYLTYLSARRFAANGGLVILDRFPLPQIKLMDGPQVRRMTAGVPSNALIRWMIRVEENYYRKIALPDLLMVLRVHPQIAVARKTDEAPRDVLARSTEIWEIPWQDTPAHIIDASQPKMAVLTEIKKRVWAWL